MNRTILALLFLFSCKDISTKDKFDNISAKSTDSLISTIMGKWGGEYEPPIFEIKRDSVYYFSDHRSYYFLIHEGDMIVLYKNGPYILKKIHTSINSDTLLYYMPVDDTTVQVRAIRSK